MTRAKALAEGAAETIFKQITTNGLLGNASNTQPSADNPQIIHLIGHSRGAAVNSLVAHLLSKQGYHIDQYTALDGFSSDWPAPGNLGDISIVDNILGNSAGILPGVGKAVNYEVQDGLAPVLADFAALFVPGGSFSPATRDFIISHLPANLQAPDRPAPFINDTIEGDNLSGLDTRSNHLNVVKLYTNSDILPVPTQFVLDNYEGQHLTPAPAGVRAASTSGFSRTASSMAALTAAAATKFSTSSSSLQAPLASDVVDGGFEALGNLAKEFVAAGTGTSSDPAVQKFLSLFTDPQFLLSSLWTVTGDAKLMQTNGNAFVQLSETDNTSIGQQIIPTGVPEAVTFDLSPVSAPAGDKLEVLFNDQVIGTFDLASLPGTGHYSTTLSGATGPGQVTFKMVGPTGAAGVVRLDNISVGNTACATTPDGER